jgi:hypothetical protein
MAQAAAHDHEVCVEGNRPEAVIRHPAPGVPRAPGRSDRPAGEHAGTRGPPWRGSACASRHPTKGTFAHRWRGPPVVRPRWLPSAAHACGGGGHAPRCSRRRPAENPRFQRGFCYNFHLANCQPRPRCRRVQDSGLVRPLPRAGAALAVPCATADPFPATDKSGSNGSCGTGRADRARRTESSRCLSTAQYPQDQRRVRQGREHRRYRRCGSAVYRCTG